MMQFDELVVLREQVRVLLARLGDAEMERTRYLAMLLTLKQEKEPSQPTVQPVPGDTDLGPDRSYE